MEKLVAEIREMALAGFDYNEIMSSLISQGHKPAEISEAMDIANDNYAEEYDKRNPIFSSVYLPFAIAALVFILFFLVIPDSTFVQYDIFLTIVGAFSFAGSIAWGLFRLAFRNVKKLPWLDNSPIPIIIASIISLLVFGGFLISKSVDGEHDELLKHGVLAQATVQDGKIYKSRRSSTATITVAFRTKKGVKTAKVGVSTGTFDSYYKGQYIIVLYSEEHPNIVEEINHKSQVEYYKLEDKILAFKQKLDNQ